MGTPAPDTLKRLVDRFDRNRDAVDGTQLTAYSLRPSDSGPSAVSRKPMADTDGRQLTVYSLRPSNSGPSAVSRKPRACSARGWDVANKAGLTEVFKPVIHEESVKIAGATKAPDYTFTACPVVGVHLKWSAA